MRRLLIGAAVIVAGTVLGAAPAAAHPLGNFTVNAYTGLVVGADTVTVTHVIDLAEVPTLQARPSIDTDGDGESSPQELSSYAEGVCADADLDLRIDGGGVSLRVAAADASTVTGEAGLSTVRIDCDLTADVTLPSEGTARLGLSVGDDGRVGWREVTARGDGTTLVASTVPSDSVSDELTAYPESLLASPLDVQSAALEVRLGGPALDAVAAGSDAAGTRPTERLSSAFAGLIGDGDVGLGAAVLALLLAAGLGAAHALAPGHGKTVMAFYLTGSESTSLRAAATVGATVTVTHTVGVLALGAAVSASAAFAPEAAYPWLAAVSGLLVLVVGAQLLRTARGGHGHTHGPGGHTHGPGGHTHGDEAHAHPHHHTHPAPEPEHGTDTLVRRAAARHTHHTAAQGAAPAAAAAPRRGGLVAMGLAGGLVPSPSALVVLLGAIAVGRAELGILLVTAFGVGMALTLTATGVLVAKLGRGLVRSAAHGRRPRLAAVSRALPLVTAAGVCVLGAGIALGGLVDIL